MRNERKLESHPPGLCKAAVDLDWVRGATFSYTSAGSPPSPLWNQLYGLSREEVTCLG